MRITPLDVRKQEFRRSVRGFDCDEVRAFLSTTADEYEAVLVDNKQLRERIVTQDDKIIEYRDMERTLRDTLMTAERLMQETRDNATREGELIVREAGIKAQRVLDEARAKSEELRREIQSLYQEKESYLARFRGLAEAQITFIEGHNRDFEDLDRQLMRQAESSVEKAVAAATRTTPTTPSVEAVAETVAAAAAGVEADAGADAGPDGGPNATSMPNTGQQDDVWRHYTPGGGYGAAQPGNEDRSEAGQSGSAPRKAAALDTEALQVQVPAMPPGAATKNDKDDSQREIATEQESTPAVPVDGP